MKRIRVALLSALIVSLLAVTTVLAQTEGLKMTMSRDWGYGGFNNDIQGLFSFHVSGPDTLVKVEFYIDDIKIGEDTQAPFALQFTTDDYPLGLHQLYAIGITSEGEQLRSNEATANFVPPQSVWKFIAPVLAVVFLALIGSAVIPLLTSRKKMISLPLGTERNYGLGGGGVCPKCKRPFALPLFSMNLGLSKFGRCPYCGKWSVVRVLNQAKLREAEQAELLQVQAGQIPDETEEEKLKKELEDSRFQGLQ
jgi:hypothetical protein